ncbi:MAG: hypothetical protein ACRCWQ_08970 [Bacilli bacterium]
MSKIDQQQLSTIEHYLFLPMVQKVFQRDYDCIANGPFKVKKPYLLLIEESLRILQKELFIIKKTMRNDNLKAYEHAREDFFTSFIFMAGGYEEEHRYYNLRIRQCVEEHMNHFLELSHQRIAEHNATLSDEKVTHELAMQMNQSLQKKDDVM